MIYVTEADGHLLIEEISKIGWGIGRDSNPHLQDSQSWALTSYATYTIDYRL